MNITKETLNQFRKDFATSVKDLESKYGIQINIGNIRYDKSGFKSNFEVKNLDVETGAPVISQIDEYRATMMLSNIKEVLKHGVIGKKFTTVRNETVTVTGYKHGRKNCFVIELATEPGKTYMCAPAYLKSYIS